ncbi:MAG: PDR/VanB family oxidoreductase [Novosphingobium sp.]
MKIAGRDDLPGDVAIFHLEAADGGRLPPFEPGAHIDVEVSEGMVRQYSLCSPPVEGGGRRYRIAVLRELAGRGGSAAIHAGFKIGDTVKIGAPRNLFPLDIGQSKVLLLGAGIGVTPLLAMAYALRAAGRPFELYYCARDRAKAAFLPELEAEFGAAARFHSTMESQGVRLDLGEVLARQPEDAHVYICGPAPFIEAASAAAIGRGFASAQVHYEHFGADVDLSGDSFEVVARRSGKTVTVGAGETILGALAYSGIMIPKSCEQGVCGTCLVDVIDGAPDHRDHFLTEDERAEGDQIVTCCSRSLGQRLVLDI